MPSASARIDIVVRETVYPGWRPMFETIAFLSTIAFIVVFVALLQMDRASRRGDEGGKD